MSQESINDPTPTSHELYNSLCGLLDGIEYEQDRYDNLSRTRILSETEIHSANSALKSNGLDPADEIMIHHENDVPQLAVNHVDIIPSMDSVSLQIKRGAVTTLYMFEIDEETGEVSEERAIDVDNEHAQRDSKETAPERAFRDFMELDADEIAIRALQILNRGELIDMTQAKLIETNEKLAIKQISQTLRTN